MLYLEHRDEKGLVSRGQFVGGVAVVGADEPWSGDYTIEQGRALSRPSAHVELKHREWVLRVA